jgi:hypothetical protein
MLAAVDDTEEEAVEPKPAVQTRGQACRRVPPLACRGRGRPSCDASRALPPAWPRSRSPELCRLTMAWREEEESRRLSMLTSSPCSGASGGHGGELQDGEVAQGDVLEKYVVA